MNRSLTIWVLLGLIAVALIAYFAFNRPEAVENAEDAAIETATSTGQVIDRGMARTQAAMELTALEARVEAGETYASLEGEFTGVRANLARAYENAEGEAAQEWNEISADFDSFEASARAGTSNFLDLLAGLIGRFSADVRVETPTE